MASGNSVSVSYQDGREVVTVNGRPIPGRRLNGLMTGRARWSWCSSAFRPRN